MQEKSVPISIWCAGKNLGLKMQLGITRTLGAEDYIARFVEEIVALMNCLVFIYLYQHLFYMYVMHTADNGKV